jgi:thiamine-monophosphate kinase
MSEEPETLRDVGEIDMIRRLLERVSSADPSVVLGPGDDCALLAPSAEETVLTCDALVEGVHFDFDYFSPEDLGHRVIAANLSDLASMGAEPWAAVLSLAAPGDTPASTFERLYDGIAGISDRYGLAVVGGDVVGSRSGVFISVALLGKVPPGTAMTRAGAVTGDVLVLTGEVGLAQTGLDSLGGRVELPPDAKRTAEERHLRPEPRVELGRRLRESGLVHACIDTSDSLAISFYHIATTQNLGVDVDGEDLPISTAASEAAAQLGVDVYEYALDGGEDFELLFAVAPENADSAVNMIEETGCRGSVIGTITEPGKGVTLSVSGGLKPIPPKGFSHF